LFYLSRVRLPSLRPAPISHDVEAVVSISLLEPHLVTFTETKGNSVLLVAEPIGEIGDYSPTTSPTFCHLTVVRDTLSGWLRIVGGKS
jgi:hypothetical protein